MNQVIVIGGGIGGLASAALLAKKGYSVQLFEKNDELGGRARKFNSQGFHFDMGPSWYMMPDEFEKFYQLFGKTTADFYNLKLVDPHYKIFLQNHNEYSIYADLEKNIKLFDQVEPGAGEKLKKYLADSKKIYDLVINDLIYLDYQTLKPLLNKKILANLKGLKLQKSFHAEVAKVFKNPDLQKILEFTTVFLGGSPYNTPAFYTLISHTDFNLKIWHPEGGIYKIIEALETLCQENQVQIHTNEKVEKIKVSKGKAESVITSKGEYEANYILNNSDYHHCETQLLEKPWQTHTDAFWEKKTLSPSAFVVYLGIDGQVNNAEHHNFYFDDSWLNHFKEVFVKPQWPKSPSYYVHLPTKTDPTLAPDGKEIMYFLVPVAPGLNDDDISREHFADQVILHFENLIGSDYTKRILVKRIFSHRDFINDYNAYKGVAFGLAHTLSQTALFRPRNKSRKVDNLYYVGQYTNPGIGMPLCLISAQIVTNLITKNEV